MTDGVVTVAVFADSFRAEFAKDALEDAGIKCFLADKYAHGLWGDGSTVEGIELQVRAEDAKKAKEILDSLSQHNEDAENPQ